MTKHRERRVEAPPPSIAGRVPPHDLDSEAAGLSTVMLERDAIEVVSSILRPEDHYSDANRYILEACIDLRNNGRPIDIVTVASWLRAREWLERVGGAGYLAQIVDATPAVAHVEMHAQTVAELARLRRTIATLQRLTAEAYGPDARTNVSQWIAGAVEQVIETASSGRSVRRGITSEDYFARHLEALDKGTIIESPPLVYSGIRSFDRAFGPMRGTESVGILAYSGNGKSALVSTIIANVISVAYLAECSVDGCAWHGENPGLPISTPAALMHCPSCLRTCGCRGVVREDGCTSRGLVGTVPQGVYLWTGIDLQHNQYLARMAARFAACPAQAVLDVVEGRRRADEADPDFIAMLERIARAIRRVRSKYLKIVDDPDMTIEDIADDVRATRIEFARDGVPLRVVSADYFQTIPTRDGAGIYGGREGQLTHVSNTWTRTIKAVKAVGLFPAQPNDEARNAGRPPIARDVRWSRSWEQDADAVISIDNPASDCRWMKDVGDTGEAGGPSASSGYVDMDPDPVRLIVSKYRGKKPGYVKAAYHPTSTRFDAWEEAHGDWQERFAEFDRQRQQSRKGYGNKGRAD